MSEFDKLTELSYFHPDTDRHKAECMLLQNGEVGNYLIRNGSDKNSQCYVVSVRAADAVQHFHLYWRDDHFAFGHGTYDTVEELAEHFENKPLLGGESGRTTVLTQAYPRSVHEPGLYATVRIHAEATPNETQQQRKDFSINSKSGFLTKVGGIFKTWNNRWFVLQKNELKYFKHSNSKSPLRVLDLNECLECEMDKDMYPLKKNVFRLKFSWRTFYMFASSEEESQEWVKTIKWKLGKE